MGVKAVETAFFPTFSIIELGKLADLYEWLVTECRSMLVRSIAIKKTKAYNYSMFSIMKVMF